MPRDQYTIRAANSDDLVLLPAIEQAAAAQFRTTHYAELTDFELASTAIDLEHEYVWVVVDCDDQPVGFAIAHAEESSVVHLHELDVHPQHARQGLGCWLIETVAKWAQERGAKALTLTTFGDVPWNGPYYERLGFQKLEIGELSSALQSIRNAEAAAGLPMVNRICMQLDL
jgi:GNAT superfamily N-acetyltransferase